MITVEEALARVLSLSKPMPVEEVALQKAAGRWLAHPVAARRTQPPFRSSAMDGYAVAAASIGDRFQVVGESAAGRGWTGQLATGQALRIFTGAPVPDGAEAVILQEDVTREGDAITVNRLSEGANIRPLGDDFTIGAEMSARLLRPADLALLAAMNLPTVPVRRRPVVAIVATGDELVMPGEEPGPDQIIASNSFALKALAEQAGAEARMLPIARDTEADLFAILTMALDADLVVTIGGASVGDHDLVGRVTESMGLERAFYKIAMRPGKPLMAGRVQGVPLLGLPGNPVSAVVCGHLFLVPLIRAMLGDPAPAPRTARAILARDERPTGPRTHYMRARLEPGEGLPLIRAFDRQDSALLSVLAEAEALLIRPQGDGPRRAGEIVEYLPI